MPFPPGVTINDPQKIGAALQTFIQQQLINARAVVIGLPARWIVAQQKEVPAVDEHTLSNILRLQAEAEFSTELKDLVYDYAGGLTDGVATDAQTQTILLAATPRKYLDFATEICAPSKLNIIAVTASAMALGDVSSVKADTIVLAVASGNAEITAQRIGGPLIDPASALADAGRGIRQ